MPVGKKSYKVNDEVYEIPVKESADFLKDYPDATEVKSFIMGKDTFDIPLPDVESFISENPDAKSLKKKVGSINFEKSSLQSGNDLSQSQSPSPLPSEESSSINPILGEITQIKDLESRTKDIPMPSSGKGGNIVVKAPDDVSIGEAKKKKEQFKELYGIDADEFSSEIEGLPEIAYTQKGFTPEELIQIKKDNPQNYQRRIATAKVQVGLRDKINQQFADGNIDEETRQYLINSSKSNTNNYNVGDYNQQRGIVKGQAALIDQVGGEDAEKLKSALATERSKVYGDAYKNGFDNIVKDSEESKYLSNNALLGYQYIKDLSPEKAKQYERLFIDAKSLKDKPNEQKGYNHLMQTLEETGVNLQLNAINEDLNSLNKEAKNNGGGLSPEQLSKAEQLEKKYNELTTYNNELDSKYPDRVDNKVDDALQEVLGQRANFGGYLAGKLFTSVAHTAEGVWEAVSTPFMSDASNNMRELAIMGENLKEQYTFHKTDKNKSINDSQLLIQPELQSQIDIVKNNKSLSDEQKEKQVTSLLKNNLDKFGRVPIKGGKFDVSPSSILYGVTDIAATLVPFIALESVTGGGASAGAARKFISTFTAAAATSFHDEYAAAIMDGKPQSEAYKYAMASTAISSFAMAGAGTADAIKKMAGMETSAGKIINKMTDSEISAMMSKTPKALRSVAERIKATPKMFAEGAKAGAKFEGFMAAGNEFKNQVLGTPIDREQNFKQSLIGVLNFGILGAGLGHIGYKSPTELQKSSFLETGKNPTEFIEQARQMVKEGNLSSTDFEQVKNNIESSAAAYKNLPTTNSKGQPLSEKDKGDYLYNEAVKNEALKKQLPPRQKEKAEHTALVADFKNDYILDDKQLESRKSQLEKSLEPKKDAEGKTIEPNEKEVKESKAELEAINDIINNNKSEIVDSKEVDNKKSEPTINKSENQQLTKEADTKLSEPIEGLDEQGIPLGDNVPAPIEIQDKLLGKPKEVPKEFGTVTSVKDKNGNWHPYVEIQETPVSKFVVDMDKSISFKTSEEAKIYGNKLLLDKYNETKPKEIESKNSQLENEAKAEVPENTIQAESEGAVNSKAGEVEQPAKEGGQKPPIEPPKGGDKPMNDAEGGGDKKGLDKMAANIPNQGVIREYMSKDTIEKYTNETPQNNQEIIKQELLPALLHGEKVIEKSKEVFGDEYVEKLLDYVGKENLPIPNKALIYISLENALAKEKLESPNVERINKLQKLVYEKSQAFSRENSLALNMARLRKIAEVGYDTNKITDSFFSSKELEKKSNIEKSLEADADTINKEAEIKEVENEQVNLDRNAEIAKMVEEGVAKEIDKIYKELPTERRKKADKAIAALESIQKKLRSKLYDAGLGLPVAVIDAGITTIKNAIKAGVKIADAIELGINKIKEKYGKKWEKEDEFRKDFLKGFEDNKIDVKENDKSIQQTVKEALIDAGFNRTTTIKGEKRKILDWKKLAGEEGSIDKVKSNVEKALLDKGMSKEEVQKMQGELIEEYNKLRSSIIEKSMNELAKRNKESVSPEQKGAAKKLAELYNYGLFEKDTAEYDKLINTAIGSSISPQGFEQAKKIANAMQTLYSSSFKGVKLNDVSSKAAMQQLENNLRLLLSKEAKMQGNNNLKIANIVKTYMDIGQTMILNNLKQAVENPFSGLQQNVMEVISGKLSKDGIGDKAMSAQRSKMARTVYKDMLVNDGVGYGDVQNQFSNRGKLDDYVNKLSDNQVYQGVISTLTGKATLDSMDAMFKSSITEKKFATNLIKILTNETNPNRMPKEEAIKFVSEKLTGQTFKDAQQTAKEIIEKINKDAGEELVANNPTSIDRVANDIVKSALEMGDKITTEQINAAYKAAYKAAGEGLGHEANNFLSSMVGSYTSSIESKIQEAVKEKDWNRAAYLTYQSTVFRNMINPFVGGGTNWLVLKLEKTGLGIFTGLGYQLASKKRSRIDLSSESGAKNLEKALYNQARFKDKYMRGVIGGGASLLTYLAFLGIANTDDYRKWRDKNKWSKRYLDTFTPEFLLAQMAAKDDKLKQYFTNVMNKNDAFDASTTTLKAIDYASKGETGKMWGAFGDVAGTKFNFPLPWRLVKDGQVLYQGVTGQDPYNANYKPSIGFANGVFKGGVIEWLGFRPK